MIKILTDPDKISQYLEDIKKLANSQKEELGFIPYSAYDQSMCKGDLFVATIKQKTRLFAGFILLGGRFPTKRIFQLAVSPQYHRRGIGAELVNAAVKDADKRGFFDIVIKVGERLPANQFWEKAHFVLEQTIKGGQVHSQVNIRIREIRPSLFSTVPQPRSGLHLVVDRIPSRATLYLLDTNILLDVTKERPDSKIAKNLLRLVHEGDIEVAIAQEAIKELERHCQREDDLVLQMANSLRRLSIDNGKNLMARLSAAVFPDKSNIHKHDASDIKHIATAISNHARGFITRDEAILRKHEILWNKFNLEVLSPADFWSEDESSELDAIALKSVVSERSFSISPELTIDAWEKIAKISSEHKIDEDKFHYAFIKTNGTITALCALEQRSPRGGRARNAFLFLPDNCDKTSPQIMLDYLVQGFQLNFENLPANFGIAINLAIFGNSGQVSRALKEHGYCKTSDGAYIKTYAGPIIGEQNWKGKKEVIRRLGPIDLPDTLPKYQQFDQNISLGPGLNTPLHALEDFLSAILVLPDRGGVILPIREAYADGFFALSSQCSLLPLPEARLSVYKSYFGSRLSASRLAIGKLLFFYQSQARNEPGKVIAVARIIRSNIASKRETLKQSKRRGVLEFSEFENLTVGNELLETVFTHSVIFPNPVTLKRLREIGCEDRANFVTAFNINHQQVCKLLKEGGIL